MGVAEGVWMGVGVGVGVNVCECVSVCECVRVCDLVQRESEHRGLGCPAAGVEVHTQGRGPLELHCPAVVATRVVRVEGFPELDLAAVGGFGRLDEMPAALIHQKG